MIPEVSAILYFAYTALISPDRLSEAAPSAEFHFIAHLPEAELVFPIFDEDLGGGLPSVRPMGGQSVWGAVFEVPEQQAAGLDRAEQQEGRTPFDGFTAVDRQGGRHQVRTHTAPPSSELEQQHPPSPEYMETVVKGARHWGLPAGWVAGLEEHVTGPLI